MKAVILVGGRGTRLRPLVKNIPKPLARVSGRPFLDYLIATLTTAPIDEIILSAGYKANKIQKYLDKLRSDIPVKFVAEKSPLGTGGALKFATGHMHEDTSVLALNGDTLNLINFFDFCQDSESSDIRVLLRKVRDASRFGAAKFEGKKLTGFSEKSESGPAWINAGVYLIKPKIFRLNGCPDVFSFEDRFLRNPCHQLHVGAFKSESYFIDIGIPDDFERAQLELPRLINV